MIMESVYKAAVISKKLGETEKQKCTGLIPTNTLLVEKQKNFADSMGTDIPITKKNKINLQVMQKQVR